MAMPDMQWKTLHRTVIFYITWKVYHIPNELRYVHWRKRLVNLNVSSVC